MTDGPMIDVHNIGNMDKRVDPHRHLTNGMIQIKASVLLSNMIHIIDTEKAQHTNTNNGHNMVMMIRYSKNITRAMVRPINDQARTMKENILLPI